MAASLKPCSLFLALACLSAPLSGELSAESSRIRYLMNNGRCAQCFDIYEKHYLSTGKHDLELVQELALSVLREGYASSEEETQVLALFGAGISMNDKSLTILQEALHNRNPMLQLVAISYLAQYQNDDADDTLREALNSPLLLIRLEALLHLVKKGDPAAVGQLESLMKRVDPSLLLFFPELFAAAGTPNAIQNLRRLMVHSSEPVRVEAVLNASRFQRDDLIPEIRKLAKHHLPAQQEACASALGGFQDRDSMETLRFLSQTNSSHVRLAALSALYEMGDPQAAEAIVQLGKEGELFAISLLGNIPEAKEPLSELRKHPNLSVRINATLALLELQDERCVQGLVDILIRDSRDLAFTRVQSPGRTLSAWRAIPSASHNLKNFAVEYEISLKLREAVLLKILEMNEPIFLEVASALLECKQKELVPTVVALLENHATPEAIALLKKNQQLTGAPLVRSYCNLALYRLKQEGPYLETLQQWLAQRHYQEMIRFRPFLPREFHDLDSSPYQLTPEDTSRLLIETYESLAQSRSDEAINTLLHAIQYGNSKNRYALAGLLMRTAQ